MPRILLSLFAATALAQTAGVEQRNIAVPAGVDPATEIPLTVIHGAKPGPTLALIAGNHGYEYPPILALQQSAREIRPAELAGTVYIVHIANVPSFLKRSLFVNPYDGKNLNRVYPGKADGTQAERIAYAITKEVIEKCDALLDLHGGDGNESLRPYVYQTVTGDAALDSKIAALAAATRFDHIVIDRERPADAAKSIYCSNTAITRGKPAVTLESGTQGTREGADVERLVMAVRNVLRHLGMIAGKPMAADHPTYLDPVRIVPSPATGIYYPLVERGAHVAQGAPLARITDFHGKTVAVVRAPFAGVVLYIISTPPVNQGDPAVFLGAVKQ